MARTHKSIAQEAGRDKAAGELAYLTTSEVAEIDTTDLRDPLSGEWAGESIPEISSQLGIDLEREELADAYEDSYWSTIAEMVTAAREYITERME